MVESVYDIILLLIVLGIVLLVLLVYLEEDNRDVSLWVYGIMVLVGVLVYIV